MPLIRVDSGKRTSVHRENTHWYSDTGSTEARWQTGCGKCALRTKIVATMKQNVQLETVFIYDVHYVIISVLVGTYSVSKYAYNN